MFTASMPFVYSAMAEVPKASDAVILKFWYTEGTGEEAVLFQKLYWFQKTYPDIDVVAQSKDFFGIGNLYRQAFIAGEDPDVVRAGRDNVPDFAEDGLIYPVTDYFDNLSDFLEPSIALMTYKGDIWGMPQLVDSQIYMYNKDLFSKAGVAWPTLQDAWNWTEFNTNIALLNGTLADGQTIGAYALSLAGPFFSVQPYYYGKSAEFFDGDYTIENIAINSTTSRTALTELFDLVNGSYTPPWAQQGWDHS
jgi:ABC-type glycerol-3-phosphate transport system substrate-binding protein